MSEFRDFSNEQLENTELSEKCENTIVDTDIARPYDYLYDMYCDEFEDLEEI